MTTDASTTSLKPMIITAWVFLLLASSIPTIIRRELFHQTVSEDLRSAMAAVVMLTGLALTFIWKAVRSLRPFFLLFLFMVGIEWFVFTKVDHLALCQAPARSEHLHGHLMVRGSSQPPLQERDGCDKGEG